MCSFADVLNDYTKWPVLTVRTNVGTTVSTTVGETGAGIPEADIPEADISEAGIMERYLLYLTACKVLE